MAAMTDKPLHATMERLFAAARELQGVDAPADVARLLNVSDQTINNWSRRGISKEGMLAAQERIGCNATWIATGGGPMRVRGAIHNSATSDKPKKSHIQDIIEGSPPASATSITGKPRGFGELAPASVGRREIPVISYVQAGMMTEAMDPFSLGDGFETVVIDEDYSEHTFALRIKGNSMLPMFEPGDTIIIDPSWEPRPGEFVVAKNTEEEATFKKYRPRGTSERGEMVFELVPLNDDYPTLNSERDHLHIIGVMAEHRRPARKR